jgi:hypothetical protein
MVSPVSLPQLENVRLATAEDISRIALVASASFFWSPTFQFQRPFHAEYPEDTFSSYCMCSHRSACFCLFIWPWPCITLREAVPHLEASIHAYLPWTVLC